MRALAWPLAAMLLASCALFDPPLPNIWPGAQSVLAGGRSSADELAAYMARLSALGDAGLSGEARRQRQVAGRAAAPDLERVKAAMALTMAQHAEEGEILALVEPVARKQQNDASVRAMASFLQAIALDRRRLRESATAAGTRLREERRAHEALRSRADAAQERAALLQQKLDALTELEKSLSDRQSSR